MKSKTSHDIKHRSSPRDEFYTPEVLAKELIKLVPLRRQDICLDNASKKNPVFLHNMPNGVIRAKCENFFDWKTPVDWMVTNPPYSKLDDWLRHSMLYAKNGFAYLLSVNAVTPRRIEMCEKAGFGLVRIHLCKVFEWYGMSAFCIWRRGERSVIGYDRIVWRHAPEEKKHGNV